MHGNPPFPVVLVLVIVIELDLLDVIHRLPNRTCKPETP